MHSISNNARIGTNMEYSTPVSSTRRYEFTEWKGIKYGRITDLDRLSEFKLLRATREELLWSPRSKSTLKSQVPLPTRPPSAETRPQESQYWDNFGHLQDTDTSSRTYKAIVSSTAKSGYRPDLRAPAVARASAIRFSQRPKKDTPEAKVRGAKATKAAAAKDE